MRRFRYEYGAGPLHLLSVLACFGVAGFVALRVLDGAVGAPLNFLIWFVAAIAAHDFVLFPLYSAVGALGLRLAGVHRALPADERRLVLGRGEDGWSVGAPDTTHAPSRLAAMGLNHVRVPALLSGLLFLVWFPLILGLSAEEYRAVSGLSTDGYLERWLLLSGVLFGISGLAFALRLARLRRAG